MDMYGLGSASWSGDLKDDSMDVAKLGASALVGAGIAKAVTEIGAVKSFAGGWVAPFLPIAIGVGVHNRLKGMYPIAAPGVAAGMVAVGVGKLIGKAVAQFAPAQSGAVASYVPFAGLGYTYDSPLMGLGYSYGAGVDAYMNGSPTQVQSLMGMPVQVQTLSGLGSTIVGNGAPMSAALM